MFAACGRTADFARAADALVTLSQEHAMDALLVEAQLIAGRVRVEHGAVGAGPHRGRERAGGMQDAVGTRDYDAALAALHAQR